MVVLLGEGQIAQNFWQARGSRITSSAAVLQFRQLPCSFCAGHRCTLLSWRRSLSCHPLSVCCPIPSKPLDTSRWKLYCLQPTFRISNLILVKIAFFYLILRKIFRPSQLEAIDYGKNSWTYSTHELWSSRLWIPLPVKRFFSVAYPESFSTFVPVAFLPVSCACPYLSCRLYLPLRAPFFVIFSPWKVLSQRVESFHQTVWNVFTLQYYLSFLARSRKKPHRSPCNEADLHPGNESMISSGNHLNGVLTFNWGRQFMDTLEEGMIFANGRFTSVT